MIYELSEYQIATLLEKASEAGAKRVIDEMCMRKKRISQIQAYKTFGETNVKRWKRDLKIIPVKIGQVIYYEVAKLEKLSSANELIEKHFTHEREG